MIEKTPEQKLATLNHFRELIKEMNIAHVPDEIRPTKESIRMALDYMTTYDRIPLEFDYAPNHGIRFNIKTNNKDKPYGEIIFTCDGRIIYECKENIFKLD